MIDFEEVSRLSERMMSVRDCEVLYSQAMSIGARNILEIGSGFGGSSCILGEVARQTGGHLYTFDPDLREPFWKNINHFGLEEYVTSRKEASPWINPESIALPIDFAIYDGDHRVRAVMVDYHYWTHYVRLNGLIAFHDWENFRPHQEKHRAGNWVRLAVSLIMEADWDCLEMVDVTGGDNLHGLLVMKKVAEFPGPTTG